MPDSASAPVGRWRVLRVRGSRTRERESPRRSRYTPPPQPVASSPIGLSHDTGDRAAATLSFRNTRTDTDLHHPHGSSVSSTTSCEVLAGQRNSREPLAKEKVMELMTFHAVMGP